MTAKQSSKIDRCINEIDRCINADQPIWNEVGWSALVADIDLKIGAKQAQIAKLDKARKQALKNAAEGIPIRWNVYGLPALPEEPDSNAFGWEALAEDIDLKIEDKQVEIAKLRKARKQALENAAKCRAFQRQTCGLPVPEERAAS